MRVGRGAGSGSRHDGGTAHQDWRQRPPPWHGLQPAHICCAQSHHTAGTMPAQQGTAWRARHPACPVPRPAHLLHHKLSEPRHRLGAVCAAPLAGQPLHRLNARLAHACTHARVQQRTMHVAIRGGLLQGSGKGSSLHASVRTPTRCTPRKKPQALATHPPPGPEVWTGHAETPKQGQQFPPARQPSG